ncbi:DUF6695 family protein [Xanthomarina spongicola]|uniref:Uncharacterized protein n=1 Tax=Xanthomarina spongicola TaxID=570520 RepID=A0A316DM99_9FLAO|nr:DUF6695 family protein [Xanthomarina spongicola]PWK19161.1 hypothetical protein LX78_01641 [Xanthomarina spongicola]
MTNSGIILTLAYPETIVMVSEEWFSPYMRYVGIGKKNYVRAGHAALVLIDKKTGILEYHDFGRYITPEPSGRVRGKDTDCELEFPLIARIKDDVIINLEEILVYLATHPKLTHGDGTMYASVCNEVDYNLARNHITKMQNKHFIRYAAFIKNACNCARFVTDTLIASVTNIKIGKQLIRSKWFTPSTVGNVVIADTNNKVYQLDEQGNFLDASISVSKINRTHFLDKLQEHKPNFIGTLQPKPIAKSHELAQWLSGIAAGAWFELHPTNEIHLYVFRRISPYGNVDIDAIYEIDNISFKYENGFEFIHYSNCKFFHVKQENQVFRFNRVLD